MPRAGILKFVAAIVALGPGAGHNALLGLLGMSALLATEICARLAIGRAGIGGAQALPRHAEAVTGSYRGCGQRGERKNRASSEQGVLCGGHGRFPK